MGNDIRLENFHIERVILRKRELLRKLLEESRNKNLYIYFSRNFKQYFDISYPENRNFSHFYCALCEK